MDGTILNVTSDKWINYNESTQVYYASRKKTGIKMLAREIKKLNSNILFINGIYSWYFNFLPLFISGVKKKIISARGMLHPGALTQKTFKKKCYLFILKCIVSSKHCAFHACDENEKKYIQNIFGQGIKIYVAQNFPKILQKQEPLIKPINSLKLISIGLISPMKNILPVLSSLKNQTAKIIYQIYGAIKDDNYWSQCLQKIRDLPLNIKVEYYGNVHQSEIETVLSQSHVFILPSKSENFGHAIFEALSAGKPVITSEHTPWNHLENSMAGLNVKDVALSLKNAIKFFAAMEQEEYNKWCSNAGIYAASAIDIRQINIDYKNMFALND